MKACVFSDSHGLVGHMISVINLEKPDFCFFLGDGERDVVRLEENFPDLPIYSVRGNCDYNSDLQRLLLCNVEGVIIFATHGHLSNVKYEDDFRTLTYQAKEAGANIALFGHTHYQYLEEKDGITLLNPGTAGYGYYPGYAILNIENGTFSAELRTI
jgi:putative phosphoesterase